ncbi:MAG: aspartate kinase, partial [Aggregatilineales bacterium]
MIVISALEGVTDNLLQAAHLAKINNPRGYRRIAATLRTRHIALVDQLPLDSTEQNTLHADINQLLFEMLDNCQQLAGHASSESLSLKYRDRIASIGERLSARILAALLRQNNLRGVAIDATDLIITDDVFGYAKPDLIQTKRKIEEYLLPLLRSDMVPVVTGYIGATSAGDVTTMGRGGSDYSASILSQGIHADEIWMWSDVDGMMSADPIDIPDAKVINQLSYGEVEELAYFGARILHPRMIKPLRNASIPLRVKNIYKPDKPGTLITDADDAHADIKAITMIRGIRMMGQRNGSLERISRIVDEVFAKQTGSPVEVMISSQSSSQSALYFVIPTTTSASRRVLIEEIEEKLQQQPDSVAWELDTTRVVTVIGENLNQKAALVGSILQAIDDCPLMGYAPGPNGNSLSLVFSNSDYAGRALNNIHALIHLWQARFERQMAPFLRRIIFYLDQSVIHLLVCIIDSIRNHAILVNQFWVAVQIHLIV